MLGIFNPNLFGRGSGEKRQKPIRDRFWLIQQSPRFGWHQQNGAEAGDFCPSKGHLIVSQQDVGGAVSRMRTRLRPQRALCHRPISWRATATRPKRPVGGACRSDGRRGGVRSNPFDSALWWSWPRLQLFGPVEPHRVVDQKLALQLRRGRDARDHVDEVTVIGNVRFHVGVRPVGAP